MTLNLSYSTINGSCTEASCSDDVEESTLIVSLSAELSGRGTLSHLQGLVVSVFSIGCLLGALIAGGQSLHLLLEHLTFITTFLLALSDLVGRKLAIIIGGLIFIVGGGVQAATYFFW